MKFLLAPVALVALPSVVLAHSTEAHSKAPNAAISTDQHAFGVEGYPKRAGRTIAISMDDTMHYSQSEIRVKQGETVTFVISNKGKLLHELVSERRRSCESTRN